VAFEFLVGNDGRKQPAMNDPEIANKRAYWESNGQIARHIRIG
jgi:hypothetical protein